MAEGDTDTPAPWHAGLEGEALGLIQTRGWDRLDPAAAAKALFAWGRDTESKLSWPSTETVRWPKDPANDPEGMKAIYARLGAPAEAKDYDFSQVKFSDGSPLDDKFVGPMREAVAKAQLTPTQMNVVVGAVAKFLEDSVTAEQQEAQRNAVAETEALKTQWGANMETNTAIAKRAALNLGVPEADFNAAMQAMGVGHAKTMQVLHKLGVAMGEARYITGENPQNNGVMTLEQAQNRLAELNRDSAWIGRYLNGGVEEAKEMKQLTEFIVQARHRTPGS